MGTKLFFGLTIAGYKMRVKKKRNFQKKCDLVECRSCGNHFCPLKTILHPPTPAFPGWQKWGTRWLLHAPWSQTSWHQLQQTRWLPGLQAPWRQWCWLTLGPQACGNPEKDWGKNTKRQFKTIWLNMIEYDWCVPPKPYDWIFFTSSAAASAPVVGTDWNSKWNSGEQVFGIF